MFTKFSGIFEPLENFVEFGQKKGGNLGSHFFLTMMQFIIRLNATVTGKPVPLIFSLLFWIACEGSTQLKHLQIVKQQWCLSPMNICAQKYWEKNKELLYTLTRAIRNSDVQQDWCYEPHICQYHTHQSILFWPKICHFEPLNFWIRVWKRADPLPPFVKNFHKTVVFFKVWLP